MTAGEHAVGRLAGPPIAAVLFDYGMTLVTHIRPSGALERAYDEIRALLVARARRGRVPSAAMLLTTVHDGVEAAVAQHERSESLQEIALRKVYAEAYRSLGLRLDRSTLLAVQLIEQRAWFGGVRVPAVTMATLGALRWRGVRVGICSNAPYHPIGLAEQLDHLGLRALVDSVTFSVSVGWRKPAPRIFRRALRDLGASPASTLMVGDRTREDVDGAHGVGMRAARLRAFLDDAPAEERAEVVLDSLDEVVALVDACRGAA